MTNQLLQGADPLNVRIEDRRRLMDSVVLVGGFICLYLLTRPQLLSGDGAKWVQLTTSADHREPHYGGMAHFLQIPLAHAIWTGLNQLGLAVSSREVLLTMCLVGNLVAIVFIGLIAEELLESRAARWLASTLFGLSLTPWVQWNGELYGLGLGFITAAMYFYFRRSFILPAFLWALAVVSHTEFAFAAPAFFAVAMIQRQVGIAASGAIWRAVLFLMLSATCALGILLSGGWIIGRWRDVNTLMDWYRNSYGLVGLHFIFPAPLRALKGLVTAYSVAGHFWADIARGRGALTQWSFLLASSAGMVVLLATTVFLAFSVRVRPLFWVGLAWTLPVHIIFNWRFMPAVDEYHAAALPGFVLLVTGGLLAIDWAKRFRVTLVGTYVVLFAGLNLLGGVLPLKVYATDALRATEAIRRLDENSGNRAVFVTCSNDAVVVGANVEYLRVRRLWREESTLSVHEVEAGVVSWMQDQMRAGKEVYVLGRACYPGEWVPNPQVALFDFAFLGRDFELVPTPIRRVPLNYAWQTNSFSWHRVDIFRAFPKLRH